MWHRDMKKKYISLHRTVEQEFAGVGVRMKFNDREIELNNEEIVGDWKCMKNRLDKMWRIKKEEERKNQLKAKNQQGQVWSKFEK